MSLINILFIIVGLILWIGICIMLFVLADAFLHMLARERKQESDVDEAPDDLQPCGHPESAIVSVPYVQDSNYCGMCLAEARNNPPIALKPGWRLPDPPKCKHGETAVAAVHWTGDGWVWGWDTDCCGPDPFNWGAGEPNMIGAKIEWPFVENMARPKDWQHAGFEER